MTDPTRLTNLPSSTSIKQMITPDSATTPAAEQKSVQTGIASTKDSFEVKQQSSLFTANPNTGEVKFGDGLSGKTPPIGTQNIASNRSAVLLRKTKSEISSFLKGEGGTAAKSTERFGSMKQYLLQAQNQQIDKGMKEAGEKADIAMSAATTGMIIGVAQGLISIGSAVDNLKHTASEAKSDLRPMTNPALESRYQRFTSLLDDLEIASNRPDSKAFQQQANKTQLEVSRLDQAAEQADEVVKNSTSQRDRIRDAVLDFLNKMKDIDPHI